MENLTVRIPLKQPIVFELEGFYVPPGYGPLFFVLALLTFMVTLLGNGVVMWVIVTDKSLHRPMFVMVCNLVVCDLLGATAVLPRLVMQFLTGQKAITYIPAIVQAFCVHSYGVAMQTILAVMAYDRYIAVCEPLRYHSIMTPARLHCCCGLAWFVAALLIFVLFSFHINVPLCGRTIKHVYCTNRAILRLGCISTPVSNIYGLAMTWSLSTGVFLVIAFSYTKILSACLKQGRSDRSVRTKAFQTCATHLLIYLLYEIATVIIIMLYRFPSVSRNIQKFLSILFIIVPPAVNPFIYGLIIGELRASVRKHFTTRVHPKLMENETFNSFMLQLEGLNVFEEYTIPVFLFLLFSYLFIMVSNVGIVILVFTDRNLHQPMYLLFCNLPFNDILGNSIMVPRLLIDILLPPSERLISYYECVVQAFTTHMFGTTSHTVLMIMAFDRYVAICNPLRYPSIMNNRMVLKLTAWAWGVAFVLVGVLLGLTVRLSRCRRVIMNPYCDNASLFKLSCESVFINNVYGITFTVVLLTSSIGTIVLTYTKITVVCLTSNNKSLNSKALKTCSTHLLIYLIMVFNGMSIITLHRFPQYSDYRKLCTILFHIVPGSLNPVIYGVQSKEIRKFFSKLLRPVGTGSKQKGLACQE
ncbi:uncharacterized protein LOC115395766 [Salarias fasciatus]|uniref:uncharacterized protein LOC115395766 n=1 Tax=Salarias fasciatus TaxID=181472 RepID=UPI001176C110|nr:uncharacterized protein LOC115395766 [Salarias fasciatus]